MLCPACRLLAPLESGYFELKTHPFQPDRARYIHQNCNKLRQLSSSLGFMIALREAIR